MSRIVFVLFIIWLTYYHNSNLSDSTTHTYSLQMHKIRSSGKKQPHHGQSTIYSSCLFEGLTIDLWFLTEQNRRSRVDKNFTGPSVLPRDLLSLNIFFLNSQDTTLSNLFVIINDMKKIFLTCNKIRALLQKIGSRVMLPSIIVTFSLWKLSENFKLPKNR